MRSLYPWYFILHAVPSTKYADGFEDLNIQFLSHLYKAMHKGDIKLYSKNGMLKAHPKDTPSMHSCVYPAEINSWLQRNNYPYVWQPSEAKKPTLKSLAYELEIASCEEAQNLRAKGMYEARINKDLIATKVVQRDQFKKYEKSTVEKHIYAKWWRQKEEI